jgi:cytochrome d ubiquinol oxidase subunit I
MSIGLGVVLIIMEGLYLKTKNKMYENLTKFWVKIFALTFALGVASGIVMEFQFGTNWATYSRFVGDVFGSPLAAEGIFAFFLESGFLAILVFGWDKVKPITHFISTIMVALGAHFSAIWIVVANSWMQTPAGYHIVERNGFVRAEITDFWAMVFNPSSMDRLSHVIFGCWLTGAFFVISVSAYYILKNKFIEEGKIGLKIGLAIALVASLAQLITGHSSAKGVAENQPAKLAAMEAHFEKLAPADLYLFGWVDEQNQKVNFGVKIPGLLSWLIYGDTKAEVKGLNAFPEDERPPINIVFQSYHIMIAIGMLLILISSISFLLMYLNKLFNLKAWLYLLVFSVVLPHLANQFGWIAAEVGRQPWIVYGLLKTKDALSKAVDATQVGISLFLFTAIYLMLFFLFLYLLDKKIKQGPSLVENIESEYQKQKELFKG